MGKSSHLHKLHNYTDEELSKTGVYAIISKVNNKIYIGSASHLSNVNPSHSGFWGRWNMHLQHLERNIHHSKYLQRHFNKHGINSLKFEILGFHNPEECESKESEYIILYNTIEFGFNESIDTKLKSGKENPNYKDLNKNDVLQKYGEVKHIGITAKYFNVGKEKICTILEEYNILRQNRTYTNLDYNSIYNEYIVENLSVNKLALKYNVDKNTISNNFKKLGYKMKYEI